MDYALLVLLVYILFVTLLLTWAVRRLGRKRRLARAERRRPRYEGSSSISDWEVAAQKSLDWSQGRRNNKGGK